MEPGHGTVTEPLSQMSAKLTDPQSRLLADFIAWMFPAPGYRLEAVVHQSTTPSASTRIGITVKLVRLRFWLLREGVVDTTTFWWTATDESAHEVLARVAAGWAERLITSA